MRAFSLGTLPLVLVAGALSGIAGYAFGVHSVQRPGSTPERTAAAVPSPPVHVADPEVLTAAPSWTRWPQLTDF
jgi:hypothetical protein